MANTPVEAFDTGSNYNFGSKMEKPKFPSSVFDLSHLVATTINNCGDVQIIDCFPTLPGDDFELSIKSLLRALPQVVPLYSRQRIYTYAFYSRISDLWQNFNVFMTKGYTGDDVSHTIPMHNSNNTLDMDDLSGVIEAGSLADGLGLPQGKRLNQLGDFNILKAMMLLRIWRDYFCNRNHYITDRVLLPDDDTRFRIDDNGHLLSALDENVEFRFDLLSKSFDGYQNDKAGTEEDPYVFTQFSHDWPDDYFTSALPWPQRGTAATLQGSVDGSSLNGFHDLTQQGLTNSKYYLEEAKDTDGNVHRWLSQGINDLRRPIGSGSEYGYGSANSSIGLKTYSSTLNTSSTDPSHEHTLGVKLNFDNPSVSLTLNLNSLRELAVDQTELEKMARTDGSYYQFGLTFFGERPKNAINFKPVYIGGCYDSISYTEVLQTSQQYTVSEGSVSPVGSPLGTYGGHGIGTNNGYLGRVHCDDFGYIMILSCVMPDVYYSQGMARDWFLKYQSDMFLPERAKLGLRPILKKELVVTGNSEEDENLWAWQNPFDEYRYLPNIIKGKIADPNSENFWPYTQSRKFNPSTTPEYGKTFAEASDVRKDYLASYNEVAFTAQFLLNIRAVRPLPYKPVPADILN